LAKRALAHGDAALIDRGRRLELEFAVDHAHRRVERERNGGADNLQLAAHVHVSVSESGDVLRREPHLRILGDVEEVG
jgi:hypothetical protein